jgi:threonine dehydrogenase-like Zn-dependent dehydrogenase
MPPLFHDPRTAPPATGRGLLAIACAAAAGAVLMYLLDPEQGRRRRAMLADRSRHYVRGARDAQRGLARRALHQVQGTVASVRHRMTPPEPVDDTVLVERVRAALGHVIGDPRALDVRARDGRVILKGPVTADEIGEIVACAERVRGVQQVENRLSPNPGQGLSPG